MLARRTRSVAAALTFVLTVGVSVAQASAEPITAARGLRGTDVHAPRRGTAGASYTTLTTRRFRIEGSPYRWSFEATQYRSGPGVPPEDPNLRVIGARIMPTGPSRQQAHTWTMDLPAGSLQFDGELRHVGLDTGLIPGYGAIFMDLEDLSRMSASAYRCPRTGEILSRDSVRKGVLRGSMTFLPGYSDPQMPDDVNISHVRANITRTRYTGNDCDYPNTCDPGKTLTSLQIAPGGGYMVNAGTVGHGEGLAFQQQETVGVATVNHLMLAYGDAEVLDVSSTTVAVHSDIASPFAEAGGTMSWTKGTRDVHQTRRCRTTGWQLVAPTGSFNLHLDSGDQTVAAPTTAQYEIVKRR